jgi:hypothetical protein
MRKINKDDIFYFFHGLFRKRSLFKHGFVNVNIAGSYEDLLKRAEDRLPLGDVIIVYATK